MRDNHKPPLGISIAGWVFSFAMFFGYRSYVERCGRLPGQINTWRPSEPPVALPQPEANSFRVMPTLDGHVKVVPTLLYLENGKVLEGVPDAANCIQWRYRR